MTIQKIQILANILASLKPGLCSDTETFFSIRKLKSDMKNLINEHEQCVQNIMIDYDIKPEQTPEGLQFVFAGNPKEICIINRLKALMIKNYNLSLILISQADYKTLMSQLNMEEIEYSDCIFSILC